MVGLLSLLSYPPTARISTGLVAWYEGRLVWALGNEKYWSTKEGVVNIPVIGIGGGMEPGKLARSGNAGSTGGSGH